jgi:uncharacterized protein involved in outer membrane biogenesis
VCAEGQACSPTFEVQFANLNAGVLQAAILGAHEEGTLLSTLIARLDPSRLSSAPTWPTMEGTVKADSLVLGPLTLTDAAASVHVADGVAEISGVDADMLGGHVEGQVTLQPAGANRAAPAYTVQGQFENLNPAAVGRLVGSAWTGRNFDGEGKVELSGFTGKDLAASGKGTLHFAWQNGSVANRNDAARNDAVGSVTAGGDEDPTSATEVPAALTRFDLWTADAEIGNGSITLKENLVRQGSHKRTVAGAMTLSEPPALTFTVPRPTQAQR